MTKGSYVEMGRLQRGLVVMIAIQVVATVGYTIQIQNHNSDLEHTRDVVEHIDSLAKDLEDVTPEEQAQNSATAEAVSLVPVIYAILCDEFPEATDCRQ